LLALGLATFFSPLPVLVFLGVFSFPPFEVTAFSFFVGCGAEHRCFHRSRRFKHELLGATPSPDRASPGLSAVPFFLASPRIFFFSETVRLKPFFYLRKGLPHSSPRFTAFFHLSFMSLFSLSALPERFEKAVSSHGC